MMVYQPACDYFAVYSPRVTGGISVISSILIIIIIIRSPVKLTTVYHRLMFGMSCADILSSVAMSLTNLPKPPFDPEFNCMISSGIGNLQTCEAQGFLYVFGMSSMFSYNGSLCVYYACVIALQMRETIITKYIEPLLHIIAIGIGLAWAIPPLVLELYNPTTWDAWCSIALKEAGNDSPFEQSLRNLANIDKLLMITCTFMFSLTFICFASIILRVFQIEQSLYGPKNIVRRSRMNALLEVERSHRNTKVLLYQALAYFTAYVLTMTPLFVKSAIVEPLWLTRLFFILMPLQGCFNAMIFIYHKVYNYRQTNEDATFCSVFKQLFKGSVHENILFSRISLIHIDEAQKIANIEVEDEMNNEQVLEVHLDQTPPSVAEAEYSDEDQGSRNDLSGFSTTIKKSVEGDHETNINGNSHEGMSFFSNTSSPELESQFTDNVPVNASIDKEKEEEKEKAI
mmetsp:Transcript_10200/g.15306  ORF Transcript_10200/g.15306 Transcript_10200/m.15306 type:complete len:456 (-) Transcript_10200:163-1530(-)